MNTDERLGILGVWSIRSVFICVHLWFLALGASAAPISVTDDLGRAVELKSPAQRIVSLAPFLTEMVFSVGAGERLVAVSAYSDFPPEARRLPEVANAAGIAMEPVAALRPDVVLAWKDSIRASDIDRFGRLGIPVVVVTARHIDDVARVLRLVGRVSGREAQARSQARAFEERIASLRKRYAQRRPIAVLLEVWHQPLTTIAGPHTMNEALALCGAPNLFADLPGVAPVVPWEEVYRRDPEAIVVAGSAGREAAARESWADRGTLRAVREHRVLFVDADTLQRPGPRLAEGVASLCEALDAARGR